MLGPVRAWRDGTELDLGPVRRRAVLVALVLRPNVLVGHERLLDAVWGQAPPGSGRRVLPSYVYPLRKALDAAGVGQSGSVILSGGGGYRFVGDGVELDVADLAERAGEAHRAKASGDLDTALERFSTALDLFRSEPLAGLPGPFAEVERQRLAERRRALRLARGECLVLLGRSADALDDLAELSSLPGFDPYDESLVALRMRALYGSERPAEALKVYQEMYERLRDDLAIEPGNELRRVHEALLNRDDEALLGAGPAATPAQVSVSAGRPASVPTGRPGSVPTGRPGSAPAPAPTATAAPAPTAASVEDRGLVQVRDQTPVQVQTPTSAPTPHDHAAASPPPAAARSRRAMVNELPGDVEQLVGRERELALLTVPSAPGAVTVMAVDGTAGVGKTTLVVRAAHALRERHPDGCLFVDLRAHGTGRPKVSPQRVLRRLLRSIGAADSEVPGDLDDLTAAWRTATSSLRLLLVLDDALGAGQVRPLLPTGPGSTVLVASRRRLAGLDTGRRVTLEPLEKRTAVSLLTGLIGEERARREPEALRELVGLCDRLPLALRISGSRLQTRPAWTLAYLVGRMANEERRLGELTAGDRSVEAAFRLSYDQLSAEQRRGFRALGLAPTVEFDVRTAAAMLGLPLPEAELILEGLVDTSLVQQPRPGRYRLHDLVRVHARRLARSAPAEADAARAAVLRLYLEAGRTASDWGPAGFRTGPAYTGPGYEAGAPFPAGSGRTDAEGWKGTEGWKGAEGWQSAERWLDGVGGELTDVVAYAAALGEADLACWIAEGLSDYLLRRGRYHEGRAVLEIALGQVDRASDRRMPAALRNCMGIIDAYVGRYEQALTRFGEALDLSRERADRHEEARALTGLGATELGAGRLDRALPRLTVAVEMSRRLDDDWLTALALLVLGMVHHGEGRHERALACCSEAHDRAAAAGRPIMIARALTCAADVRLDLGDHREAEALLRRSAELVRQAGDVLHHALVLGRLGSAELAAGDPDAAVDVLRQALLLHASLSPVTEPNCDRLELDLRRRLGQAHAAADRIQEAREQFRLALSVPAADTYPTEHSQAAEGLAALPPEI
ncbi:AfsR/SARP family transcriptional regulator [Streptomyces sp. NPDC002643]